MQQQQQDTLVERRNQLLVVKHVLRTALLQMKSWATAS
jgi:hypothetical protein